MNALESNEVGAASALARFLHALATDGKTVVSVEDLTAREPGAMETLELLDAAARRELGFEAPPFEAPSALWASRLCYRACQLILCRDLGDEAIERSLTVPCPLPRSAPTDWSVDLTLRHLPRLIRMASSVSTGDPLVRHLKRVAADWPLSSIGVPGLQGPWRLEAIATHPGLWRLYVDRVTTAGDLARADDPRVAAQLRVDAGAHPELLPAFAQIVRPSDLNGTADAAPLPAA